jgi:hypothetical protein
VLRIVSVCLLALFVLTGCAPESASSIAPITDPTEALREAVEQIRSKETFRILIEQTGVPYRFQVSLDAGTTYVSAIMRRGEAQFIVPDELYATVRLEVPPLPTVNVEIFAQELNQFFRLAGGDWINFPIAEGFNPGELVRDDSGFALALGQMRNLEYVGTTNLIDGTLVQHVRGTASGQTINNLMFNLLSLTQDNIIVDVYLEPETRFPLRLTLTLPDTATEREGDTTWNIELYDINAPARVRAGSDGRPVDQN